MFSSFSTPIPTLGHLAQAQQPVILIADDDQGIQKVLTMLLKKEGYKTIVAKDGEEAIRLFQQMQPDLVLLDVMMPKMDGVETCKELRRMAGGEQIPILIMTALADNATVNNAFQAGATDYFVKPIHPGILRHRINLLTKAIENERKLADLKAMTHSILVHALDAIITYNPTGRLEFANPAAERMFGYQTDELLGKNTSELFSLRDSEEILFLNYPQESTARLKNGRTIPVEIALSRFQANQDWFITAVIRDISERKQSEIAMRESRSLLEQTLDSIKAHIAILDESGVILSVNAAWREFAEGNHMKGGTFGIGSNYLGVCNQAVGENSEEASQVARGIYEVMSYKRDEYNLEYPCHSPTRQRWFSLTVRRVQGAGAGMRLLVMHQETTMRRLTEDALRRTYQQSQRQVRQAEQEWMATVNSIADLLLLVDGGGFLRRCNQAVPQFFDLDFAKLIGRSVDDLFFRLVPGDLDLATSLPAAQEIPHTFETRLSGQNGKWFEVQNYPILQEGEPEGARVYVIANITARKKAEEDMRRLTEAVRQTAEAVVILDVQGKILFVNPSFETIFDIPIPQAEHRSFRSLKISPTNPGARRRMFNMLRQGKTWNEEFTITRRDTERILIEASVSPIREADRTISSYVAVCHNVTEKKRLQSIAEAVNMMDSVGYIFSGIRHEMGNPINSIKTALSFLHMNSATVKPELVQKFVDRSLNEVSRLEYLLKTLRTYSMYEKPAIEEIDMAVFLNKFCNLIADDFSRRNITVEARAEDNVGKALGDPRALHQALLNLFANAADALTKSPQPAIWVSLARKDDMILLTLRDNGIGMSLEQQRNLFKPFHTTKEKGTGLGLVITQRMITQMNGTLTLASVPQMGTVVTITLPAVPN
ncbi:MAG: PAS domain S-box protein [Blastocatellia bacterium]|nr:PAS domain S-box protein [Blastocatellia bacterium]